MELNAEQIKKALECCYEHNENCPECPYTDLYPNCAEYLGKHAFSLIKEITEENERLRADCAKGANAIIEEMQKNRTIEADTVRKMLSQISKHATNGYPRKVRLDVVEKIAKEMFEGL